MVYKLISNPGNREINEDRGGVACSGESYCFVVADGLGGHGSGEVAAQIAVDSVCEVFIANGYSDEFFEQAFSKAQDKICEEQERRHAPSQMKTTLVILVLHDGMIHYAHVGDSRLYLFGKKAVRHRTIDHSVPQMMALAGQIKPEEIRNHPDRNRLMRVMGIRGEKPRYEIGESEKIKKSKAFLLCTDGFWELIDEETMGSLLMDSSSPEEWLQKMSIVVKKNGQGKDMDNWTAIAVFGDNNKGRFHLWG